VDELLVIYATLALETLNVATIDNVEVVTIIALRDNRVTSFVLDDKHRPRYELLLFFLKVAE
jgi:hypothetical protein|tara:strand:- start:985 stop:1170 length:186 start_codon:yes stop_codon:yes gene_type:complete